MRVLADLAKTSSPNQIGLIIHILHDHLKNRGKIRYEKVDQGNYKIDSNGSKIIRDRGNRDKRQSVELALKTILTLASAENISREEIIFENLDLRGLDISNITCKLPGIIFRDVLTTKLNFRDTELKEATFSGERFGDVDFCGAKLDDAKFNFNTNLTSSKFRRASLLRASIYFCHLQDIDFNEADLKQSNISVIRERDKDGDIKDDNMSSGTRFTEVDLRGVNFQHSNMASCDFKDAKMEGADVTAVNFYYMERSYRTGSSLDNMKEKDLYGAKNLTQSQIDTIIYKEGDPPINLPQCITLPEDRAYIIEDNKKRFVTSDKSWSGRLVDEALECPPIGDT